MRVGVRLGGGGGRGDARGIKPVAQGRVESRVQGTVARCTRPAQATSGGGAPPARQVRGPVQGQRTSALEVEPSRPNRLQWSLQRGSAEGRSPGQSIAWDRGTGHACEGFGLITHDRVGWPYSAHRT